MSTPPTSPRPPQPQPSPPSQPPSPPLKSKLEPSSPVILKDTNDSSKKSTDDGNAAAPLELYVAIRKGRVSMLVAFTVLMLLLMVFTFRKGMELARFRDSDKTSKEQTKLLDDYNSYAGNIASLFGTPLEMFVTAAVQVILLRFMTRSVTESAPHWTRSLVSVAVGSVAAFLLRNGFTALNVQLRPREIDVVISAEDLSLAFNTSMPGLSTNVTHTFPETQPRNPITNTILRNAVLPRVLNKQPYCKGLGDDLTPNSAVEYGFRQHDWQARLLQEALPAKQLSVTVTPKKLTLQDGMTTADMPMNASLAADLYLYGMHLLANKFGATRMFLNETEIFKRVPALATYDPHATSGWEQVANISLAKVVGLLPSEDKDEKTQREWFLKQSAAGLRSHFAAASNTSLAQLNMSFSHVEISPSIVFDAITIEFAIDPMLMAHASTVGNTTRFTEFIKGVACGPTTGLCLVDKALYGNNNYQYDPPAQIKAFGQCMNSAGTQELRSRTFSGPYPLELDCEEASNSSLLVFSIGKRVTADALTPNHSVQGLQLESNDNVLYESAGSAVGVNVSKIFTFTIGRLHWQWRNLSDEFQASCESGNATNACLGLHLPLSSRSQGSPSQCLVVGSEGLSVGSLSPLRKSLAYRRQRMLPLAQIREPPLQSGIDLSTPGIYGSVRALEGDLLLPHNINLRNWTQGMTFDESDYCDPQVEDSINSTLNNHLYNEHGLQPAYTAAVFFLFENAVVRDVIPLAAGSTSLDFKHNVRHVAVWLSVPDQSVWLTLAGCILLVLGLAAAMLESIALSRTKSDSLAKITAPHVIARVMLDEGQFPPLLLHRHIVSSEDASASTRSSMKHRRVERFAIDSLGLQHQHDSDRLATVA